MRGTNQQIRMATAIVGYVSSSQLRLQIDSYLYSKPKMKGVLLSAVTARAGKRQLSHVLTLEQATRRVLLLLQPYLWLNLTADDLLQIVRGKRENFRFPVIHLSSLLIPATALR
jgi:hypothetical protein